MRNFNYFEHVKFWSSWSVSTLPFYQQSYHEYMVPRSTPMMGSDPSLGSEAEAVRASNDRRNREPIIGVVLHVVLTLFSVSYMT